MQYHAQDHCIAVSLAIVVISLIILFFLIIVILIIVRKMIVAINAAQQHLCSCDRAMLDIQQAS